MSGRLITLEGIDGSGKSTAARYLAKSLRESDPYREVLLTAEPTGGSVGGIIRSGLACTPDGTQPQERALQMQELFLFMADHADHLAKTVLPALRRGAIVISDRYSDSTRAYQSVTLREIVPDPITWIGKILLPWDRSPELTLLFQIAPESALQRLHSRRNREKFERLEFLEMVDENFRRLADAEPERFVSIDASLNSRSVGEEALRAMRSRLALL